MTFLTPHSILLIGEHFVWGFLTHFLTILHLSLGGSSHLPPYLQKLGLETRNQNITFLDNADTRLTSLLQLDVIIWIFPLFYIFQGIILNHQKLGDAQNGSKLLILF